MKYILARWKAAGIFGVLFPREFYRRLAIENELAKFTVATAAHAEGCIANHLSNRQAILDLANDRSDVLAAGGAFIIKREGHA